MTKKVFKHVSKKEKVLVAILDKNNQVCGGPAFATHKGRPCKVVGRQCLCPVTVTVVDETTGKHWQEFDHYEDLCEIFG